jgi:hypothetical protein
MARVRVRALADGAHVLDGRLRRGGAGMGDLGVKLLAASIVLLA